MMGAPRKGRVAGKVCVVLAGSLLASPGAFALNPTLDIGQYAHTPWKIRDGFVKGVISSIAQTPDGYLWLGTEFGLVRFDGVKPVPWTPPPGQQLPSGRIFSLLTARDGTLWIGSSKGLASWKAGKLTQYPALAGQSIRDSILEDHEGTIWAGGWSTSGPGALCAIQKTDAQCYGQDGGLANVSGLYEDRNRRLWVGVRDGLWRWKPGPPKFFPSLAPAANAGGIQGLIEDDDGALLFGPRRGISRIIGDKPEADPLPGVAREFTATRLLRDGDGNLWIGTADAGLVHVHQGRTDGFTQAEGLSGDFVTALFTDREGSVWVATDGGLDRFREYAVPTLSLNQGLSNASVVSILADRDGSVWLSTRRGLNRWSNGQITVFGDSGAQGARSSHLSPAGSKPDGLLNGNYAGSLFQDSRGRIWASTLREFGYLENGRFASVKDVPGGAVYSITEDMEGDLWIANKDRGLIHLSKSGEVRLFPWSRLEHKDPALALAVDSEQGGLWIGFNQGGIVYFADGQVRASYSARDRLGEGRVNDLRLDRDGALWAGTDGGLSRLKSGRIATLNSKNGLPCDGIHWTLEDNDHSFWLYTTCGLVRIGRPELDAWVRAADKDRNAKPAVRTTVFDISDGVRTLDDNGGYTPHAVNSSDGRLWFLPSDGASVVDPRRLPFNRLAPPVRIEKITADRKIYEMASTAGGSVSLPPLVSDLAISFTALSLVAPEKVRFRYKLEGKDSDWREDVDNRRQALYSDLAPRSYRFRVIACNNSGVWNEAGAILDFSIAPAYYQTVWFRLSFLVALFGILWAGYRLRLRQLAWQFDLRTEERVNERTRIARDLHDTMLQSFQAVLMKFHSVLYQLEDQSEARKSLESVIAQASEAVTEGRNAVQGLRSSTLIANDLARAIGELAAEFSSPYDADNTPEFRVHVEGASRDLVPLIRDDIHRIASEAVRNAFRHARASLIEVEIRYENRQLRLRILDDGKGIDEKVLSDGGRPGHFGLAGMRERAKTIGGKLVVRSRADGGTEAELTIPASAAYAKSRFARSMVSGKGI